MAVKTKARKTGKKAPAKKEEKGAYECGVCGYRLVVDKACGCEEEHVIMCCSEPMKKT
jgi:hypothetical protein